MARKGLVTGIYSGSNMDSIRLYISGIENGSMWVWRFRGSPTRDAQRRFLGVRLRRPRSVG